MQSWKTRKKNLNILLKFWKFIENEETKTNGYTKLVNWKRLTKNKLEKNF
jgi:hypothetical protein